MDDPAAQLSASEQATLTIAAIGIIATAVVAIAGLVVQLIIAAHTRKTERRRKRYDELVNVYSEVGRGLSLAVASLASAVQFNEDGKTARIRPAEEVLEETERDARELEFRHFRGLLRMYGADQTVLDAINTVHAQMYMLVPESVPDAKFREWWDAHQKEIGATLRDFYQLAGIHARKALKADI